MYRARAVLRIAAHQWHNPFQKGYSGAMKTLSSCCIVVPGLSEKYRTGGLMVLKDIAEIFREQLKIETYFVATHETHPGVLTPADLLKPSHYPLPTTNSPLFLVSWGPIVESHIKLIRKKIPPARILYYAQSFGWNIKVPAGIPIVCVSRYVMAQWALHSPNRYIAYIPPPLHDCFHIDEKVPRDIDVLVHTRKQNDYCLRTLVPALRTSGLAIHEINEWIAQEKFAALLQRTKIFLYLTDFHKAGLFRRLPGEGFGLPALEALACGALVGSNLLGGVTDFLTPGENCIKLQNGDLISDTAAIKTALQSFQVDPATISNIRAQYNRAKVAQMWGKILAQMH